jgi:flagellar hook-basal body complex protein FliE
MPAPISPISSIPVVQPAPAPATARPGGFGAVFESALSSVENTRQQSTETVEKFLSGEGGELHTTVLATQRAELSFQLFLQARNKVVDAYQEIMRMQM